MNYLSLKMIDDHLRSVEKCSSCGSTDPHKHPAVQHEGEVQVCPNQFHGIDQQVGFMFWPGSRPRFVSFGHEKYRGEIAVNEVEYWQGHPHLTTSSVFTLSSEHFTQLKETGRLDIKRTDRDRRIVFVLIPADWSTEKING